MFCKKSISHETKIEWIMTKAVKITNALVKPSRVFNDRSYSTIMVSWIPPPEGWITLNNDGSVSRRAMGDGLL